MLPNRRQNPGSPWTAVLLRLGQCALMAAALGCSGCAWFKSVEPETSQMRDDPKETRVRPKREEGRHIYGGMSSEAQAIERNLGI